MTKHFSIHFFSFVVCLALSNYHKFGNCHSFEKVDGIAKLKKYLNHLGYIPNSPSNFTNDFDDDLQLALRTYQENFKLNVTGELDDQTLRHVERPRCGHPDIINGINTMSSRKKPTSSAEFNGSKLHAVSHYKFFAGNPAWGKNDLTYAFIYDVSEVFIPVFVRAFKAWSDVSNFTFTLTTPSKSPDITIWWYSGEQGDDVNVVNFSTALGYAYAPPKGRLYINTIHNWSPDGDFTQYIAALVVAYDLETTVIHEIGHVLGLDHSNVEASIMWPTIDFWTEKVLQEDDIQGLHSLYSPTTTHTSTTSSLPVVVTEDAAPPDAAKDKKTTATPPPPAKKKTSDARSGGDYSARSCWELGVSLAVAYLFQ